MEPVHQRAFMVLNATTAPWWLAMIVLPRSRVTARLVDRMPVVLAGLGVSYGALLFSNAADERIDFTDAESVRRGLQRPEGFLAGWAHYLAFDLFVGRWIWRTALDDDRGCRIALLLTWLAGPLGLTVFLAQRRIRPRS